MESRTVTAQLPNALIARVDDIIGSMDRSRSWAVKQALVEWVENEERRHRMTLDGLADVEAGRVVGDGEVSTWIAGIAEGKALARPGSCD